MEIKLLLDVQGKSGLGGIIKDLNKISGTADQVDNALVKMATNPHFSAGVRHQIALTRRHVASLAALAEKAGKTELRLKAIASSKTFSVSGVGVSASPDRRIEAENRAARRRELIDERNYRNAVLFERRELARQVAMVERQRLAEERHIQSQRMMARRAAFATAGFGIMSAAGQAATMFDSLKVSGLTSAAQSVAGKIGDILGSTFSQIFSEITRGVAALVEALLNVVIKYFTMRIKAIVGFISGFALSMITFIFAPMANLIIGTISGTFSAIIQLITGYVEMIVDVFKAGITAIGAFLNAAFTAIRAVFEGFINAITAIWKAFWEGLKGIVEFSINTIQNIILKGLEFSMSAFEDFIGVERRSLLAFSQIADVAGNVGLSLEESRDKVMKYTQAIQKMFGIENKQAANTFYTTLSSGFRDFGEANRVMTESIKLSTVGMDDAGEVTKTVTSLMNAYGMKSDQAADVTRKLFAVVNLASMTLEQFRSSLGNVIGAVAQAGFSIEDWGTIVAGMSYAGLNAAKISVGLNRAIQAMQDPTTQNSKAMKALKFNFKEMKESGATLTEMFDALAEAIDKTGDEASYRQLFGTIQAVRVFRAYLSQRGKMGGIHEGMVGAMKQYDKEVEKAMNSWDVILNRIKQIYAVFKENFARSFADQLRPLFKEINRVFDSLNFDKIFASVSKIAAALNAAGLKILSAIMRMDIDFNLESITDALVKAIEYVAGILGDPKTYQFIINLMSTLKLTAVFIYDLFKEMFSENTSKKFVQAFSALGDFLIGTMGEVFGTLGSMLIDVLRTAVDFLDKYLGDKVRMILDDIFKYALDKIASLIEYLATLIENIAQAKDDPFGIGQLFGTEMKDKMMNIAVFLRKTKKEGIFAGPQVEPGTMVDYKRQLADVFRQMEIKQPLDVPLMIPGMQMGGLTHTGGGIPPIIGGGAEWAQFYPKIRQTSKEEKEWVKRKEQWKEISSAMMESLIQSLYSKNVPKFKEKLDFIVKIDPTFLKRIEDINPKLWRSIQEKQIEKSRTNVDLFEQFRKLPTQMQEKTISGYKNIGKLAGSLGGAISGIFPGTVSTYIKDLTTTMSNNSNIMAEALAEQKKTIDENTSAVKANTEAHKPKKEQGPQMAWAMKMAVPESKAVETVESLRKSGHEATYGPTIRTREGMKQMIMVKIMKKMKEETSFKSKENKFTNEPLTDEEVNEMLRQLLDISGVESFPQEPRSDFPYESISPEKESRFIPGSSSSQGGPTSMNLKVKVQSDAFSHVRSDRDIWDT